MSSVEGVGGDIVGTQFLRSSGVCDVGSVNSTVGASPSDPIITFINTVNDGIPQQVNAVAVRYDSSVTSVLLNSAPYASGASIPADTATAFSHTFQYTYGGAALQFVLSKGAGSNTLNGFTVQIVGSDMSTDLSGLPATATAGSPYSGTIKCTNNAFASASATSATCSITGLPAGVTAGTCTPVPPATVAAGASISCPGARRQLPAPRRSMSPPVRQTTAIRQTTQARKELMSPRPRAQMSPRPPAQSP